MTMAAAAGTYAEIDVTPRIAAQATWTDNVNLDQAGRQSDLVLSTQPGINIEARSQRLTGTIDYAPSLLVFLDNTSETTVRQRLSANLQAEVVRETFFVNAGGSIGQRFADLEGPLSGSDFNFSNNRRTVQNYFVRPRLTREFGSFATATLNYTFSYNNVGNPTGAANVFSDSIRHGASAVLNSGSSFTRLRWSLRGDYDNVERARINARFEDISARAEIEYALGRTLSLLGSGGYEDTEDATLTSRNGPVWDAGFRWRPGPRTDISFRGGRRFGDETFSGSFSYRLQEKAFIRADYVDEIEIENRLTTGRLIGIGFDENGVPINDSGVPVPVIGDDISLTDNAFRRRNASLTLGYGQRRITYRLRGFFERRTFDVAAPTEESIGVFGSVGYEMGRGQIASLSFTYRDTNFIGGGSNEFYTVNAQYSVALSANSSAFVGARHSSSNNQSRQDFRGNSISVGVRTTF